MQIDPASLMSRADRLLLGATGTMRDPDLSPIDVLIDNLSETGALLKSDSSLPIGTLVTLGIAGIGMQMARVSRATPGALAVEFMVPLAEQAVARVANGDPLASVAIPQLPLRGAPVALDAGTREAVANSVVQLSTNPLPTPQTGSSAVTPLLYGAEGMATTAVHADDQIPTLDARLLAGMAGAKPASASSNAGVKGLWMLFAAILIVGLAYLLF